MRCAVSSWNSQSHKAPACASLPHQQNISKFKTLSLINFKLTLIFLGKIVIGINIIFKMIFIKTSYYKNLKILPFPTLRQGLPYRPGSIQTLELCALSSRVLELQ